MMEKKKTDEIALVKAAAWAWYQRGSGSEGKPMIREFDVTRTLRAPRISRFKLEWMMINSTEEEPKSPISSSLTLSPAKSDNSLLLDPYEIESISKRLESLIQSSHDRNRHGSLQDDGDHARVMRVPPERESGDRRKSSRKKSGMFWFRQAAICGSRGEVVEPILLHGLRRPSAHGSVFRRTVWRADAR